ncbi:MAG TPA: response regulator [Tepidisphaeraceae bacterium]|jgi:signal transduction histidine kinase/CheY-like chemotaxis protein/HPt (histidine-containing phosphotransfer) domain-containing protein
MRFRTKLFATWAGLVLLLWAGTLWPLQRTIASSFDQLASDAFAGTRHSLHGLQAERTMRMRQACLLLMNIPELRALIAEQSFELSEDNRASLVERLDDLTKLVGASFVCVLDGRGTVIAQAQRSPWRTLAELSQYVHASPQAGAFVRQLFAPATPRLAKERDGLWSYRGQVYQVAGVPLVFGVGPAGGGRAEGALIMATATTDALAGELARSHQCEVSFLDATGHVIASSLAEPLRPALERAFEHYDTASTERRDVVLGGAAYRSSFERLIDPCSGKPVGAMVIQTSVAQALTFQNKLSQYLVIIMASGLAIAALFSFFLSGAITRPVHELVGGVRKVAAGDLHLQINADRRDELGELAAAFNDMVRQLRTRHELQRLVEESQAASRAKSQFLASMSHEIRTPLNGVVGMTEVLMRKGLNAEQLRCAQIVKSSGNTLLALINDVLDFSKIEAGRLELENVDFDLREVVEESVEMLAQRAAAKGLELGCHVAPALHTSVSGDPVRLRQILVNLIGNAVKFTQTGEVIVRVHAPGGRGLASEPSSPSPGTPGEASGIGDCPRAGRGEGLLTSRFSLLTSTPEHSGLTARHSQIIRFEVTDTGIGIPPDRTDRLFQSFSQVDTSTTRKYGGTGLGLAICKQLAELMGGQIGVESAPGKGSTFWFTVRLVQRPPAARTTCLAQFRGLRVLAVDDHPAAREIIRDQIHNWGFEVETAADGPAALRLMERATSSGRPFGVAILDMIMPEMTGPQLARAIRQNPQFDPTTLIMLTSLDNGFDPAEMQKAGFAACLTKPIRQSQLFDRIAEALAAKAPSDGAQPAQAPTPAAAGDLRGVRVLLAEDNEINQLVAREFLIGAGAQCDTAGDGRQALEAARRGGYDVVLMDCQMPEMDGFEVTTRIRELEGRGELTSPAGRLPIVALTANAVQGDRERCLAAGMDGYVTKPIEPATLIREIRALVKLAPAPASQPTEPTAPPPAAAPIDALALLKRCCGNVGLVEKVLSQFEQQIQSQVDAIRKELDAQETQAAKRLAHTIKGTAANLAATSLSAAAAELEQRIAAGELDAAIASFESVAERARECARYVPTAIGSIREGADPSEPPSASGARTNRLG